MRAWKETLRKDRGEAIMDGADMDVEDEDGSWKMKMNMMVYNIEPCSLI